MPESLPVDACLPQVHRALRAHGAVVLIAPPGSGKTTRVPPALLERPGQVVVLEPRRVAARAAARRMADERGEAVGDTIGYQVRFERQASAATRVLLVTEGILTRRLLDDPELTGVSAVVLDEFHERRLQSDVALAILQEVRRALRPDLWLVVMSATLDPEPIARFLEGAPIVRAGGQSHPLEVHYREFATGLADTTQTVEGIATAASWGRGDILVFLPGVGEILRCARQLTDHALHAGCDIVPLYGDLPSEAQDRALQPGPRRRIILATNVAETSLTIPGVDTVVDSGLVRQLWHDPASGLDRLELRRISAASADQRAGRAGRTGPGQVLRLWSAAEHRGLDPFELPEIRRVDLAATVLELAAWGAPDAVAFGWFEAPDTADVARAVDLLVLLGALTPDTHRLTALGNDLARLPLHPRLARVVLEGRRLHCAEDAAVLAALLGERDILIEHRSGGSRARATTSASSDLLWRRERWLAAERSAFRDSALDRAACFMVQRVARQVARGVRTRPSGPAPCGALDVRLRRAILAGFPDRVVRRRSTGSDDGVMVGGRGVRLADDSVVRHADTYVALRLDDSRRGPQGVAAVHWASAIEAAWLEELFPESCTTTRDVSFDTTSERVVSVAITRYCDVVLDERSTAPADPTTTAAVLATAVADHFDRLRPQDPAVQRFRARATCLAGWRPELALPAVDDAAVMGALISLCPGRRSFAELRSAPLLDVLRGQWTHAQRTALEREAPETVTLANGRRGRLRYDAGRPPTLSATVQELFGVRDTPRVAGGRVACVVEILAPNRRPVQVTQDLASFWSTVYPQVRKDLRARYAKHAWPENPAG